MRKSGKGRTEEQDQIALFEWAKLSRGRYPELALLTHYPSGGSRNMLEAVKLKRMGVRAGYPDIFLPVRRAGISGLFIELKRESLRPKTKRGKGGVSDDQRWWMRELWKQGFQASIAWGFDEARTIIEQYLGGK